MQLPMLGTEEKTEASRFQVTLVDNTDKSIHPSEYPRINRFFENLKDRNAFVEMLEASIMKTGGRLVHNTVQSHPLFVSFDILDKEGSKNYSITVYN